MPIVRGSRKVTTKMWPFLQNISDCGSSASRISRSKFDCLQNTIEINVKRDNLSLKKVCSMFENIRNHKQLTLPFPMAWSCSYSEWFNEFTCAQKTAKKLSWKQILWQNLYLQSWELLSNDEKAFQIFVFVG